MSLDVLVLLLVLFVCGVILGFGPILLGGHLLLLLTVDLGSTLHPEAQ